MRASAPLRVHFIAIGGTGMGSLAGLLKQRGLEVTGSDEGLYPPMSTALERWQIPVREGFAPENVVSAEPDLVVIGNAVWPDNPEARAAIDAGLAYKSFSDALYELAIADHHPVVVTGTHGKTTTTSLIGSLLAATGRDPSLLVGGISLDFGGSFREGKGPHFVVEGDEYDTAFFDKTPKFLHYHPKTLVITSVEFDHADIYRDLDHVKSAFRELVAGMPGDGTIVAASAHENVRDVVAAAPCRVVRYAACPESGTVGALGGANFIARHVRAREDGTHFVVGVPGGRQLEARMPLYGRFNVENALAALATLEVLGVPIEESLRALPSFGGVKRRQEIRGEVEGVTVVDDFAHHPTAVEGSIESLRSRYPGGRLVAIFEPRSNTSRRAIFQDAYARALAGADRVLVKSVPDEPIYSATGEVTELFSAEELARRLRDGGQQASACAEVDEIVESVVEDHKPGDVVLVMSNGGFEGIWEKLLSGLRERAGAAAPSA